MIFNQLSPLSLDQIESLLASPNKSAGVDSLLWWAANQNFSFIEEQFNALGKDIYRFQGSAEQDQINFYSFGRSEDRKLAAVKATAEIIERLIFNEFTKTQVMLNLGIKIKDAGFEVQKSNSPSAIDQLFYNSNGWAVDFSVEKAIERAMREAIERHLLILTFAKYGWDGFFKVDQTQMGHLKFTSLVSKLSVAGFSAGVAICQSSSYAGISLGYLADRSDKILKSEKWEQAFYESYDLIRVKELNPDAKIQTDLIGRELDYYLNTPFEFNFSNQYQNFKIQNKLTSNLAVVDLKDALGMPVSFYASVVHGGDLLPLYFNDSLTKSGKQRLKNLCSDWEISQLPERHPIL